MRFLKMAALGATVLLSACATSDPAAQGGLSDQLAFATASESTAAEDREERDDGAASRSEGSRAQDGADALPQAQARTASIDVQDAAQQGAAALRAEADRVVGVVNTFFSACLGSQKDVQSAIQIMQERGFLRVGSHGLVFSRGEDLAGITLSQDRTQFICFVGTPTNRLPMFASGVDLALSRVFEVADVEAVGQSPGQFTWRFVGGALEGATVSVSSVLSEDLKVVTVARMGFARDDS